MTDTATGPWREALGLIDTLLSTPQEGREVFLAELESSRPELHARVRALLDADAQATRVGFMSVRRDAGAGTGAPPLQADARLGPYRIVREIGQGGMGEVWLARRDDGLYQGEVAIKTLHPFFAHGAMRERFLREAQLLGKLAHPYIARMLDAGVSDGVVFIVLEYVRGEAIDVYCDARSLDIDARLKLFADVCAAVAHAHANLVVHRDIKPSNILVTGQGQVKLLDFGIGKLMETDGATAERSELTRVTGRIFTPEFAAPEQILGEPVTTATDVYSLGTLLYVLLAGVRPFGNELSGPKLEHAVLHSEPEALSRSASGVDEKTALLRGLPPHRLQRALANDLEDIVHLALRKRPQERYGSVLALAEDLGRYRRHEPVMARAGSRAYRMNRFVRRHRVAVAATAGVMLAAAFGVAGVLYQAREAQEQARIAQLEASKATAVKDFLLEIFNANSERNPDGARARQTTAEELLDVASEKVLADARQETELRLELMDTLSGLNSTLQKYPRVEALGLERLKLVTGKFGAGDLRAVPAHLDLSQLFEVAGKYEEARKHANEAIAILEKHGKHVSNERAVAEIRLGEIAYSTSEARDSAPAKHFQAALVILEQLPRTHELVAAQLDLGRAYEYNQRYDDAIAANRRGIELAKQVHGPRDTSVAGAHQQMGRAFTMVDRLQEASVELQQAVEIFTFAVGPDHGHTLLARADMGRLQVRRQQYRDAVADLEKVLAIRIRVDGPDDRFVQIMRHALGRAFMGIGDFDRAQELLDLAVRATKDATAKNAYIIISRSRAVLSLEQQKPAEALTLTTPALSMVKGAFGPRSLTAGHLLTTHGEALAALGRYDEARATLAEALEDLKAEDTDPVHGDTMAAQLGIVAADLGQRRFDAARASATAVIDALRISDRRAEFWVNEELAQRRLAMAEIGAGNKPAACAALDAAIALRTANALPTDPRLASARDLRKTCT